jgi:malate dehydrogenase (oxaloacetate-decarboxylating)
MERDPIVFALANPVPEIWPWEAKAAGAAIVATGRSDLPNQVNNSLIFPSVFRGALDCSARQISYEAMIRAAEELALCAEEKGLLEDYIIPTMEEWQVYPRVAAAVAERLSQQGLARKKLSYQEEVAEASEIIERSRRTLSALIESGIIQVAAP